MVVKQAKPLLCGGGIRELVDPLLGRNEYDCDEMERMTLAASLCTRTSWHSRPEMSLVRTVLGLQFHVKKNGLLALHSSDPPSLKTPRS